MKVDIYKNYTSTSVLADVNEEVFTKRSINYFKKIILPHFPQNKKIVVLEIGCGYGRYTKFLSEYGFNSVYGVDISEEQIRYAREKMGLQNVEQADAVTFLENHSTNYDVILLMDVLEHLELNYSIILLQNIYRCLNRGGVFIVQVPNGMSPLAPSFHGDVTHIRSYSVSSMSQILKMGGFTTYEHYPTPQLVHSIGSYLRKILWLTFINPGIKLYMKVANGSTFGGIYTNNLLSIAKK